MPKGTAAAGYKMTQNRKNILGLLIEAGGELASGEGRTTAMLHEKLGKGGSTVALNMTLRELENLGWIERDVVGKRTYSIAITDAGKDVLGDDAPKAKVAAAVVEAPVKTLTSEVDDWEDLSLNSGRSEPQIPSEGIDYDVLLGLFVKAALRGLEGPSNSEIDRYKALNNQLMEKVEVLEADLELLQTDLATVTSERDQLQKNLSVVMSKLDKKPTRGTSPIRSLLSASEQKMLDNLMRQVPTRQGD